jgi:hypothetical protein
MFNLMQGERPPTAVPLAVLSIASPWFDEWRSISLSSRIADLLLSRLSHVSCRRDRAIFDPVDK